MLKLLKWVVIVFATIVVMLLVFSNKGTVKDGDVQGKAETQVAPVATEPSKVAEAKPTEPAKDASTAVAVTADALVKAYDDNEIAANEKYKGKELIVSGTIGSIDADMSDKPVIKLKSNHNYGMSSPLAKLAESDLPKASTLKKGQAIKLKCIGDSEVGGTPMLEDCVIQ